MKQFKSRVMLEIMFDVYTDGETEAEAGKVSEEMVDDLAKYLKRQIETADGIPGPSECWMASWGVSNVDIEECETEE